jgi:hypothetical protein
MTRWLSDTSPVATKRDLTTVALQAIRLPALPIQKTNPGPAANYIEMKIRLGITALRFSGGPNTPQNTYHDATSGGSRKIGAKPRLPPTTTHQHGKAVRCKRELCGPFPRVIHRALPPKLMVKVICDFIDS